jgi:curved DNA-binding protein CbpA
MPVLREALEHDLYEILGVTRTASPEDLRAAYRRKARESHPDLHPGEPRAGERMARVNLAGRVLLDPYLRSAYDRVAPRRGASSAEEPRRAWYERSSVAAAGSDDWVSPPRPRRYRVRSRQARRFLREIRSVDAQVTLRFHEMMASTPERARLPLFVACLVAAALLIASARPRTLFTTPGLEHQPTTIAPAALNP